MIHSEFPPTGASFPWLVRASVTAAISCSPGVREEGSAGEHQPLAPFGAHSSARACQMANRSFLLSFNLYLAFLFTAFHLFLLLNEESSSHCTFGAQSGFYILIKKKKNLPKKWSKKTDHEVMKWACSENLEDSLESKSCCFAGQS